MLETYVCPFYAISVSTLPADADAHMSVLFATSQGPLVDYDYFDRRDQDAPLDVHSLFAFPAGAEPLVGVWARCAALMPLREMPLRRPATKSGGSLGFTSISIHECPGPDQLDRSHLLEHLVVYRQGSRLLVEFSDQTDSIERVGPARATYNSPYEMGLHAVGLLLWGASWSGAAPPALLADSDTGSTAGDRHAGD